MTIIQRHNGETINLDDAGIRTRDFIISAPTYNHQLGEIEGGLGFVDYGTTIGPREITVYFRATSYDTEDFSLLRDEIFHIFRSEESFYLIEHREPGKRWLVKVQDTYSIPQRNVFGNFEIRFIGLKGVSESKGTTQDIQRHGVDANRELWGFGMGLIADDDSLKYTHEGTSFRIFNAGNVPIHPYKQDLKITISDLVSDIVPISAVYDSYNGEMSALESPNHYTLKEGTEVYFRFIGTTIYFHHYTDNRGGLWECYIDGQFVRNISTHINAVPSADLVAPNFAKRLLADGLNPTSHQVTLIFKGADPNNSISNPRGWIRHTSETYKTFEYYNSVFELINKTNGNAFIAKGILQSQDVVNLDGPNVTKNDLEYFRRTNHKFISLEPGWNEFEVKGVSSAKISFDFPFYYK